MINVIKPGGDNDSDDFIGKELDRLFAQKLLVVLRQLGESVGIADPDSARELPNPRRLAGIGRNAATRHSSKRAASPAMSITAASRN